MAENDYIPDSEERGSTYNPSTLRDKIWYAVTEDDNFVINDIPLIIPPEQIRISSQSFFNDWQILRSSGSRVSKSGYASTEISFNVMFNGNDSINDRLRPLFAGLRSTPFCVIYNKYLQDQLGSIPGTQAVSAYKSYKPVVLALNNMTFSTVPQMPGCIRGEFSFIYFNYFPFTPLWAYKTGSDLSPGPAWESVLWKAFYKPHLDKTFPVDWPHTNALSDTCTINYMDFMIHSVGSKDSAALKTATELVNTIEREKNQVAKFVNKITSDPNSKAELLVSDLYKELSEKGALSDGYELKNTNIKAGTLEKLAGDVFYPLIQKISSSVNNRQSGEADAEIRAAIGSITDRYKRSLAADSDTDISTWKEIKDFGVDVTIARPNGADKNTTTKVSFGGYKVYGQSYNIILSPADTNGNSSGNIIEQMSVSFTPSIVTIPLVGHSHPTCQFMGGYSVNLDMTLNVTNQNYTTISDAYNRWNLINLKYRNIPQGVRNLQINCDFTKLFGLKEFIAADKVSSTIPGMPGRTRLSLTFIDAGIQSTDSIDDSETLVQEFVNNDNSQKAEFWKIINKYVVSEKDKYGREIRLTFDPKLVDKRSAALGTIVSKYADAYNKFTSNIIKAISSGRFSSSYGMSDANRQGYGGASETSEIYTQVINLRQNDERIGYIPGLEQIQAGFKKTFDKTSKEYISRYNVYIPTQDEIKAAIKKKAIKQTLTGDKEASYFEGREKRVLLFSKTPTNSIALEDYINDPTSKRLLAVNETLEEKLTRFEVQLQDIGLYDYIRTTNDLYKEAKVELSDLPEFAQLQLNAEQSSVGKGKMAYPDLKPNIMSVASLLDYKLTEAKVINYDPDIYLWSPTFDGAVNNVTSNLIIDETLLSQAERHSRNVFENAQSSLDEFFANTYKSYFTGIANKQLEEHVSKIELSRPFYENTTIVNGLGKGNIEITTVPDYAKKVPTNSYPDNPTLSFQNECICHYTSINDLWNSNPTTPTGSFVTPASSGSVIPNESFLPSNSGSSNNSGVWEADYANLVFGADSSITKAASKLSASTVSGSKWSVVPGRSYNWNLYENSGQTPINGLCCPIEKYTNLQAAGCIPNNAAFRKIDCGSEDAFKYRRKGATFDWENNQAYIQSYGGYNVKKAPYHPAIRGMSMYSKPVTKWTWNEYKQWKKATGGKYMGYMHKGLDLSCPFETKIYAVADGVVYYSSRQNGAIKGAGLNIGIAHPHKPKGVGFTRYLHLQAINPRIKRGATVKAGDLIALAGCSGFEVINTKRTHLHFETWDQPFDGYVDCKSKILSPIDPNIGIPYTSGKYTSRSISAKAQDRLNQIVAAPPPTDNSDAAAVSPIKSAIKSFETNLAKGLHRAVRAYPTFKLYFIQDDSLSRKRFGADDFFSYNAVQSIKIIKSKHIAADTCVIELTNVSGNLSNRKYKNSKDSDKSRDINGTIIKPSDNLDAPGLTDTLAENPVASLLLKEGTNVEVRLGYSSDPALLDIVFIGKIQAIEFNETDDLITFVAQSYATELQQDIKGLEKPKSLGGSFWQKMGFFNNASSIRIFEEMLSQPEVVHFGRWETSGATTNRELLTNKFQWVPNPSEDNIFAPSPSDEKSLSTGWLIKDEIDYVIDKVTIWDIFKEMERRHPNFVGIPLPYQDQYGTRMTYFFGLPNQLYFARSTTSEEQLQQNQLIKEQETEFNYESAKIQQEYQEKIKQWNKMPPVRYAKGIKVVLPGDVVIGAPKIYGNKLTADKQAKTNSVVKYRKKRLALARAAGYIKPFRNYHLFTSGNHIVANNISADSRNVANTIAVSYLNNDPDPEQARYEMAHGGSQEVALIKLDNGLPEDELKTRVASFPNAYTEALAKRYGISVLMDDLRKIYNGTLIVIGEPTLKPLDIVYIADEVSSLTGVIEVEQVIHSIDRDKGYVCEIIPNMFVVAAEWSIISTMEAIGIVAQQIWYDKYQKYDFNRDKTYSITNFLLDAACNSKVGATAHAIASFTYKKIMNITSEGMPVIMNPLLLHGREYTAGVSTTSVPTSIWDTLFGDWNPEIDKHYNAWYEDLTEKISKFFKKATGQFSIGDSRNNSLFSSSYNSLKDPY